MRIVPYAAYSHAICTTSAGHLSFTGNVFINSLYRFLHISAFFFFRVFLHFKLTILFTSMVSSACSRRTNKANICTELSELQNTRPQTDYDRTSHTITCFSVGYRTHISLLAVSGFVFTSDGDGTMSL